VNKSRPVLPVETLLFVPCCAVVGALDRESKEMLGVVTVKISILEKDQVLESERAEAVLKNAVASLGPKERRTVRSLFLIL
jgi:hypothetical protein